MAMEKLILRSIMYGADKIPDSWFDKIPGGYYNAKKEAVKRAVVKEQIEKDAREERRSHQRGSDGKRREHRRPHSVGESTRATPPDQDYDSGYRSEGHRRQSRVKGDKTDRGRQDRRSYDGVADEDYYSGDDRHRRRRHSSRRGAADDVGNVYDPHHERHGATPPHARYYHARPVSMVDPHIPPHHFVYAHHAPAVQPPIVAGMSPPDHTNPIPAAGLAHGYVPYAHIYGGSKVPPMTSHPPGTSPPAFVSPLAPPPAPYPVAPAPYQQNVNAQQAPTAEAAGAGAVYTGQPGFINTERWEPPYPSRPFDRINGYHLPDEQQHSSRDGRDRPRHSPSPSTNRSREERHSRRESRYDDERRRTMSHGAYSRDRYVDPRLPLAAQMPAKPARNDHESRRDSRAITPDHHSRHSGDRRSSRRESGRRDSKRDGYRSE